MASASTDRDIDRIIIASPGDGSRKLNRGWSDEGKVFRQMESAAAGTPGTFHFHRAVYDDDTWIPATLQYGVLRDDREWWIGDFANK